LQQTNNYKVNLNTVKTNFNHVNNHFQYTMYILGNILNSNCFVITDTHKNKSTFKGWHF